MTSKSTLSKPPGKRTQKKDRPSHPPSKRDAALKKPVSGDPNKNIETYKAGDWVFIAPLFDHLRVRPVTPALIIDDSSLHGRMFLALGVEPFCYARKEFEQGHVEHVPNNGKIHTGIEHLFNLLERERASEGLLLTLGRMS